MDSSVAVKWLVDEGDADLARPFLDFRPDAPDLIIAESTNVLWKKARKGEIDDGQAVDGVRLLTALRLSLWSGVELSQRALALSLQLQHAAYDCFLPRPVRAAFGTFPNSRCEACTQGRDDRTGP